MTSLLAIAPALIAFWGWASLALGVADRGIVVGLALVGYAGSVLAKRAPIAAAAIELVAAGAIVSVVGPFSGRGEGERIAFVVVGSLLVVSARAITEVGRRARG